MSKKRWGQFADNPYTLRWLCGGGLLLFILFGWLWWHFAFTSPQRVFWRMINNDLSLTGVTRHVVQKGGSTDLDQTTRLRYGSQNAVQTSISLSEKSNQGMTVVRTEGIGTQNYDYSRYASITTPLKTATGKSPDFSKILNVWGKSPDPVKGQPAPVQYLSQAALGLVPFVNLNSASRSRVVKQMQSQKVYTVDFGSVSTQSPNGRKVFVYKVSINPAAYAGVLQQVLKAAGLSSASNLDPSAYQGNPPIKVTFYIDKLSAQLVKLSYDNNQQTETYSGYGIERPILIPSKTVPIVELQKAVQSIQQ